MPKSAAVAVCPDSAVGDSPVVYWLRVVINGISSLIWRLLVPATIAQPHTIVQTTFGWGGEHLHRFVVHGAEYGISYFDGPGFRDDARTVRLGELGLRAGERFTYEYNFTAGWLAELRVERIQPGEPGRVSPRCTGGCDPFFRNRCWRGLEGARVGVLVTTDLSDGRCDPGPS
jgi:Plasmid pRiA4b ORF-3-like protein